MFITFWLPQKEIFNAVYIVVINIIIENSNNINWSNCYMYMYVDYDVHVTYLVTIPIIIIILYILALSTWAYCGGLLVFLTGTNAPRPLVQ